MRKSRAACARNLIFIGVSLLTACVHQLCAAEASFQVLATSDGQPATDFPTPYALSADGSVVVGQSGLGEAFRWTVTDGIVGMGYIASIDGFQESSANGVSGDGNIIVGYSSSTSYSQGAFRWTPSGGMISLVDPSSAEFFFQANAVSGDGSTIAGLGYKPNILEAARWTRREGLVDLGQLPGGTYGSVASAASYDGSVIVGYSDVGPSTGYWQAFRWTAKTGMLPLGDLPGGPTGSLARAVSADGSIIVGESWVENRWLAYRWSQQTGMVALGNLGNVSIAKAVSGDGSRVVGSASIFGGGTQDDLNVAFVWDVEHGMRDLNTVLQDEYGLDLHGLMLTDATAISADGSTIVGTTEGNYGWYAWVAHIPTPLDQLIERVQRLSITDKQKADLLDDLSNAKQFGVVGECQKELKELSFFVRKINLDASKSVIDQATGANLTATANAVISQLDCN